MMSDAPLKKTSDEIFGKCRPVSEYRKVGRIGEGTYGTVYKAIDKNTLKPVALKRIIMHNEKHDGFPLTSIREIATLRRIDHPNCVKLLDVVVGHKRDGVFLVFEYCEHDICGLLDHVRAPFSESEVKSLLFQLLSAVAHLHEHWIIHRDIKLSNLLYNNRGEVKLADFGLARTFPSHFKSTEKGGSFVPMTLKVVTLWYRAPELLLGSDDYTTAIDVWAVGCVMGELLRGSPLFPGESELDQVQRIFSMLGCPSPRIWPDMLKLKSFGHQGRQLPSRKSFPISLQLDSELEKHPFSNLQALFPSPNKIGEHGVDCLNAMLTFDPKQRITARECMRHVYFSTSPFPKEPDLMPTFPCRHKELAADQSEEVEDCHGKESTATVTSGASSFASSLAASYQLSKKRSREEVSVGLKRTKDKLR